MDDARRAALPRRLLTVAGLLTLAPRLAVGAADLQVLMSLDTAVPGQGQTVQFTVTLGNLGPDPASGVQLQDRLPPELGIPAGMAAFVSAGSYDPATGVWEVGTLDRDATATLVIPAVITAVNPPPCSVNVATVSHGQDANRSNDRAVAAVRRSATDRCVDLSVSIAPTLVGFCVTSNRIDNPVHVTNRGPDAASGVLVDLDQDPLVVPSLRLTGPGIADCSGTRCTLDRLAAGSTVDLRAVSGTLLNQAQLAVTLSVSASSDDTDYATANNQASTTQILPPVSSRCDDLDGDQGWIVGGSCFIATAAYGSPLAPQVVALRAFRDRYLRRSAPGRALIRLYYRYSPPVAAVIARHEPLRLLARALLTPLVLAIAFPLHSLVVVLLSAALLVRVRRRARP